VPQFERCKHGPVQLIVSIESSFLIVEKLTDFQRSAFSSAARSLRHHHSARASPATISTPHTVNSLHNHGRFLHRPKILSETDDLRIYLVCKSDVHNHYVIVLMMDYVIQ